MSKNLLSTRQFSEKHPAFSQPALRHLIFQSKSRTSSLGPIPGNGFDVALVHIGSRVLIDEDKFFEWVEWQQSQGAA